MFVHGALKQCFRCARARWPMLSESVQVDPSEAIQLELDDEEDSPVAEWFYDHKVPLALTFSGRMHRV